MRNSIDLKTFTDNASFNLDDGLSLWITSPVGLLFVTNNLWNFAALRPQLFGPMQKWHSARSSSNNANSGHVSQKKIRYILFWYANRLRCGWCPRLDWHGEHVNMLVFIVGKCCITWNLYSDFLRNSTSLWQKLKISSNQGILRSVLSKTIVHMSYDFHNFFLPSKLEFLSFNS